jgi:hypothetical protein
MVAAAASGKAVPYVDQSPLTGEIGYPDIPLFVKPPNLVRSQWAETGIESCKVANAQLLDRIGQEPQASVGRHRPLR